MDAKVPRCGNQISGQLPLLVQFPSTEQKNGDQGTNQSDAFKSLSEIECNHSEVFAGSFKKAIS